MQFSILIPAYNAEKYIATAVMSALNQEHVDSYEVIVINDGSTDQTGTILNKLQDEYKPKLRVIHQDNTGEYATRRILSRNAKGEYILFLDADDELRSNALHMLSERNKGVLADVVLFDMDKRSLTSTERFTLPLDDGEVYKGNNKYKLYMLKLSTILLNSMCSKMIRKDCIDLENDDYLRIANGADSYQTFPILDMAKTIMYVKEVLYDYRKNPQSATNTSKYSSRFAAMQVLFPRSDEYIDKWGIAENDRMIIYGKRLSSICNCVLAALQSTEPREIKNDFIHRVRNNSYFLYLIPMRQKLKLNKYISFVAWCLDVNQIWLIEYSLCIRRMLIRSKTINKRDKYE